MADRVRTGDSAPGQMPAPTDEGKEWVGFRKQPDSQIRSNLIVFLVPRVTLSLI